VNVNVEGFVLLLGTQDTDADSPQLGAEKVGRIDRAGIELALTEGKACGGADLFGDDGDVAVWVHFRDLADDVQRDIDVAEMLGVLILRFLVDLRKSVDKVDVIRI